MEKTNEKCKKGNHKLFYCWFNIQMGTVEKEESKPTLRPNPPPNKWYWGLFPQE
jgi:hypothetical protein